MQIFMDESGTFVPEKGLAVVSALVVPDRQIAGFEKLYKRLRRSLPKERGEVKGRLLAAPEVAAAAEIARKVGCLLETTAIDMTDNTAAEVENHRVRQVDAMARHITDEHHENVRIQIARLQEQLRAMPLQLYVQSAVIGHLIHVLLRHTSVYFALRDGRELGSYAWVIDAKGKEEKITPWGKMVVDRDHAHAGIQELPRARLGDRGWRLSFRGEVLHRAAGVEAAVYKSDGPVPLLGYRRDPENELSLLGRR